MKILSRPLDNEVSFQNETCCVSFICCGYSKEPSQCYGSFEYLKTNEPVHEISNNVVCLRSACAYAQSDQSLCLSLEYSMTIKLQY